MLHMMVDLETAIDNLDPEIHDFLQDGVLMCAVGRELVTRNDQRAIYWFRRARDLRCPDARCWLAWCLFHGFGCLKNVGLAESYINKIDLEQVSQTFGDNRLVALAGDLLDHHCGEMTGEVEKILEFAYDHGSCAAAVLLGEYYIYSWCDRDIDQAIKYLFPFRDKSAVVRNLLAEAYLPCSLLQTKELEAKGLYDESVLSEEIKHPRYWLSGNFLFVKKLQFEDWVSFQYSARNCGYRAHPDSIKRSWIADCLKVMPREERNEYLRHMPGFEIKRSTMATRNDIQFRKIDNEKISLVDIEEDSEDVVIVQDCWIMRIVDNNGRLFDIKCVDHDYKLVQIEDCDGVPMEGKLLKSER